LQIKQLRGRKVRHLNYAFVLIFVAICALGVNIAFRMKIMKAWRIFLYTDAVILLVYGAWDFWAINRKSWGFDSAQIIGVKIFGELPIEEVLFFILVPLVTVISYKTLLKLTGWGSQRVQQ
jgi:lycopene cyclase domain-containing protein